MRAIFNLIKSFRQLDTENICEIQISTFIKAFRDLKIGFD